jgi:hypothetical protein
VSGNTACRSIVCFADLLYTFQSRQAEISAPAKDERMLMRSIAKPSIPGLLGLMCLMLPGSLRATTTTYTYTGADFTITMTLTASSLDNLATLTDVTSDLSPGSMTVSGPNTPPSTDSGSFPLGGGYGSGYETFTPSTLEIGTNGSGQITAWDISGTLFASYPAFPSENPNYFYCVYTVGSTGSSGSDTQSLTTDNDAGFCPDPSFSITSTADGWGAQGAETVAPEPSSYLLVSGGLSGLWAWSVRRKRRKLPTAH